MHKVVRRTGAPLAFLLTAVLAAPLGAPSATAATPGQLVIDDPSTQTAGEVTLSGQVSGGEAEVSGPASVLYLVDVSTSTMEPAGMDCDGDGSVTAADDVNGDQRTGDTLDCEITGVRALDASLGSTPDMSSGLAAFASGAAVADLDPAEGWTTFLPAQYADSDDPRPRIVTVARSLARGRIKDFRDIDLTGRRTNLDGAVNVALDNVGPRAGQRWIVLLSDGRGSVANSTVDRLAASGVRLRAFAVGTGSTCVDGDMARLAGVTGEQCVQVGNPAQLATQLTTSAPRGVEAVEVTVSGVTVAADVDAVGRWSARLTMGAGSYTAVVRARLSTGEVLTAERAFAVTAPTSSGSPGSSPAPPPGFVGPATGTQLVSRLAVRRPAPTSARLPKVVRGSINTVASTASARVAGGTVALQARKAKTKRWTTVARTTSDSAGAYTLRWDPATVKGKRDRLRISLPATATYTSARVRVPNPYIFDCRASRTGSNSRDVTCRTPVRDGVKVMAKVRASGAVVDRARVADGRFTVTVKGKLSRYAIVVKVTATQRAVLRRL